MTADTLAADIASILDRDLRTLRRELEAYPDERQLWQELPGQPNTAGTLALHLAGNLQHYIGARWGGTGYVRDRAAEFSRRGVSRAELIGEIEAARSAVALALSQLGDGELKQDYPEEIGGTRVRTAQYLVHLCTHMAYHLGQLDAHRRAVTGNTDGVGAMRHTELGSARPVER
jgi:uncharacterized damage-inducible protein DinB